MIQPVSDVRRKRRNATNTRLLQRRFLAAVAAQGSAVPELLKATGVSPRRFGFWMANRRFRRRLAAALRALARASEVDLQLAACRASARLDKIANQKGGTSVARQACVDLVRLARDARRRKRRKVEPTPAPPSLAHPDLDPEDVRDLTARLRDDHAT